ncbi:hypothetical protein HK098_005373 [Nowakowskiella sp. JEL0407]|nr:hypothetical protein HK098_005373 [Nowakowskiella sp. JEL0407]
MSAECPICKSRYGWIAGTKTRCSLEPEGCGQELCSKCLKFAITTETSPTKVFEFCRACFLKNVNLDMSSTVTVIGPDGGKAPTILFAHGGGGCRLMFLHHAKVLAEKGFRCVLFDFPGHGSRFDESLSLDSACNIILSVVNEYAPDYKGQKPMYIGGSMGGYIGMEFLGKYPYVFSKVIIAMCGQNVGVGRGLAASMGLWGLSTMVPLLSPATILKQVASVNPNLDPLLVQEATMRSGFFSGQSTPLVNILANTHSKSALEKFDGPVLFINGSRDHRDAENVWLAACKNKESKLEVYEGADHFFSHDVRYMDRFLLDVENFFKS